MSRKTPKVLLLFSGGLDSLLAAKILMDQGIEVLGIIFKSYFFGSEQAEKSALQIGLRVRIVDFSEEHLEIVKSPLHGYGKAVNPCIDCHTLMLKKSKQIMEKEGFDFVATGEVLGERPMSQNKEALEIVKKESSLNGYLLRPLSAKLLEETIPEKEGLVDRDRLLDISGRSRKRQIELAKKYNIKEYPAPAGGCLLCEPEFGERLKRLMDKNPDFDENDVELLKVGRHFWAESQPGTKIVVGREEEENEKIENLGRKGDILIEMKNYPGPLTLVRNYSLREISSEALNQARNLTQYYSTKARDQKDVEFKQVKID